MQLLFPSATTQRAIQMAKDAESGTGSQPRVPPPRDSEPGRPIRHPSMAQKLHVSGIITLPKGHRGRKPPAHVHEREEMPIEKTHSDHVWVLWWLELSGFEAFCSQRARILLSTENERKRGRETERKRERQNERAGEPEKEREKQRTRERENERKRERDNERKRERVV